MLDLNVEIVSSDSSSCGDDRAVVMAMEEEEEMIGVVGGGGKGREEMEEEEADEETEHSVGTSDSSSVVNEDDSPANAGYGNSSAQAPAAAATAAAFVFDVFKKEDKEDGLVTRQLFPVPFGGAAGELGLRPLAPGGAAAPRTQWLNLTFSGGGGGGGGEAGGPVLAGELRSYQPQKPQQVRKSRRGPRSRSSQYRGVTFYRRTGRWESHIWDCGKQVYLGGFDTAYAAARAYDRAAIKFRGVDADINFSLSDYDEDMKQMGNLTKEEFVHILRRQSTGFSRGTSKYRGIGLQKGGRWDARMGQFLGKKAHDNGIIQYNGQEAVPKLEHGGYEGEIVLEVTCEGSGGQNLDLNLGMAPVSAGDSKKIKVAGNYHVNYIDCEAPGRELPMVACSSVSAPNKRLPIWPAMYPFLLPSSEGKAAVDQKRRAEAPTGSNVGWQVPINGSYGGTSAHPIMPPLVFSSNAASSGFSSSSSSSNSSSTHHLHRAPSAPQNPNPQLLMNMKPNSINVSPFPYFSFRS